MTPELLAYLRSLPGDVLHRLRIDTIPRLLRDRVAGERRAALEEHERDYLSQAEPKGVAS